MSCPRHEYLKLHNNQPHLDVGCVQILKAGAPALNVVDLQGLSCRPPLDAVDSLVLSWRLSRNHICEDLTASPVLVYLTLCVAVVDSISLGCLAPIYLAAIEYISLDFKPTDRYVASVIALLDFFSRPFSSAT